MREYQAVPFKFQPCESFPFPMSRSRTKTHLRFSSLGATLGSFALGFLWSVGVLIDSTHHFGTFGARERDGDGSAWDGDLHAWTCACKGHLHRMVGTARALHACWLDYAWSSTSIALHHYIIIFAFSPPSCHTRTCKGHSY